MSAQQITVGADEVDLRAALRRALRSSPRLRGSQDTLDQAGISRDLAESRFNSKITPFFSAGAEAWGNNSPSFGVDFQKLLPTGTTVRFRARSLGYVGYGGSGALRDNGYSLRLTHPLIQGFGPEPRYEVTSARRNVDSARRALAETRQRLVLEVAAAYFAIVRQQRLVAASQVAYERAERLKTASEARMSVGLATRLDVLRADLLVSQAMAGLDDRQTALADARDRLKLLIGHPVNSPLHIAGDDLDGFISAYEVTGLIDGAMVQRVDDPAVGLDSALVYSAEQQVATELDGTPAQLRPFVATALGNRIDVQQARARVEDAERAATVATWRLMPDVTLNASYSQRGLGTPWGAAFNELYGGWSVGITSSYTLDRAPQMAAFSSANLNVRAAERDLAELHERVAAEVRRAHRGIVRADKGIAIQTQAVELSERQLELAELRYERGLADNFDIIDAETNLFNAQSALVSARVDRALAGLALELAMGLLDPEEYLR